MRRDQRLVHRTWEPSEDLGLSLPRALFLVGILEKGERSLATFQVEINGLCSFLV